MEYASLQDLIEDKSLGLGEVQPSIEAIKGAIDSRLKALQTETLDRTSDIYRRLIDARVAADRLREKAEHRVVEKESNELIPVPAAMIDKLLAAIERITKPQEQASVESRSSATKEMQVKQSTAVAKASESFNRQRTLPLAGLGALAGAIWATRQAFGANLSHVGTTIWGSIAGGVILLAVGVYLLSSRIQKRDEATLRRLFDPDIQAEAVENIESRMRSADRAYEEWLMEELSEGGDSFERRAEDKKEYEWAMKVERDGFTRTDFREALALQALPGSRRARWRSISDLLSTVDLENALDEATSLALARLIELEVFHKVRNRFGLESYKR